jgi:hypothetical protein
MYIIYIVLFCRYNSHICVSHSVRTNYGDECDLLPTIRTPSIFDTIFFSEERVGPTFVIILHTHVHE